PALHPPEPGAETWVTAAPVTALAFQHRLALLRPELAPGDVEGNALSLREANEHRALPLARPAVPRAERSVLDAQRVVGEDLRPVDAQRPPETAARRTGTDRRLVAEKAGARALEGPGAPGTHQALADGATPSSSIHRFTVTEKGEVGLPLSLRPGLLERGSDPVCRPSVDH